MFAIAATALTVLSVPAVDGFSRASGVAEATADGVRVHGAVCRLTSQASPPPVTVRIEWHKASGEVLGSTLASLTGGGMTGRGLGCNTYSANAAWRMGSDDWLMVSPMGSNGGSTR